MNKSDNEKLNEMSVATGQAKEQPLDKDVSKAEQDREAKLTQERKQADSEKAEKEAPKRTQEEKDEIMRDIARQLKNSRK